MIRKKILSTTMALSLAMVISGAITGCGGKSSQNDAVPTMTVAEEVEPTEVTTEVETQTETAVATYEVIPVQMPYSVTVSEDTILMDSPDTAGKIVDLPKDTELAVTGEVTYGGVPVDFYYGELTDENGNTVEGFVDGKYLEFNGVLEDSTEDITEVEGGDGEDTTEISEETTPQSDVASNTDSEAFEPYTMYTNKNCNIRDRASKDGILVGTYPVNTKIEVIGEENGWSKFIYDDGGWAFIKSSLLSKTQVAGKAVTTPKQETDSTPAQQPSPQPSSQPQASADTSQFPPDVASSPYLSRYLGLGLSTEEIIAAVRDDEQAIIFDGTETPRVIDPLTPEEKAAIAELSKNVVVE